MRKIKNKKYHYFYKITNLINNHFYYGIHSTDDLEDGYMGSGTRLHKAYEKYGIENFKKEILKFFDSREECAEYEMEMVTEELVNDNDCYNIILGGDTFSTSGTITAKDKDGNYLQVSKYDKRWLSGELVGSTKNNITCFDNILNEYIHISKELYDSNRDRYNSILNNNIIVYDKFNNKNVIIRYNDFLENRNRYTGCLKDKILSKDKNDNCFIVNKNDNRLVTGELVPFWKDRHHTDETKRKISEKFKKNKYQQGEKNSQYGTCWIYKNGENKKIKKEELDFYLESGWSKGRKMK